MADEKILIDVEYNNKEVLSDIEATEKTIFELRNQQKKLNAEVKNSNTLTKEQAKRRIELSTAIASQREKQKELIAAQKSEGKTLEGLKARLKALTAQRNNTDIGSKQFAELQVQIKNTTERLKSFEEEGGDFRRNVGNYASATRGFGGAISNAGISVSGLGTQFKGLNGIIGASPLFALTTILIQIVKSFTSTKRGAEQLEQVMAPLNAAFGVLNDAVAGLFESLKNFFSDPTQIFQNLLDFINNNLVPIFSNIGNAIKSVLRGDFSEAAKSFKMAGKQATDLVVNGFNTVVNTVSNAVDNVVNLTNNIIEAGKQASVLEKQQQRLNDRIREQSVINAKLRTDAEALRRQARNTNLENEERIKLLEKSNKLIEQIGEQELKDLEDRLRITKAQNALSDSSAEDLQKQADQEIAIQQKRRELDALRLENEAQIGAILKKNEQERLKAAERQRKADEDLTVSRLNRTIEAQNEIANNEQITTQKRIDAIKLRQQTELDLLAQETAFKLSNESLLESERIRIIEESEAKKAQIIKSNETDILKFKEKTAKQEEKINAAKNQANITLATNVFNGIKGLGIKNANFQKALGITEATINTFKGITAALASPSPTRIPEAIATGVFGFAQVAKIAATKIPTSGGSAGGGGAGGGGAVSSGGAGNIFSAGQTQDFSRSVNNSSFDTTLLATQTALRDLPTPIVTIEEINRAQSTVRVKENLG